MTKFIDLHCDTLLLSYMYKQLNLYEMTGMLDIKRMKAGGQLAQFFAIFLPPADAYKFMNLEKPIENDEFIEFCFKAFGTTMSENSALIAPTADSAGIAANEKAGKMSGLLTFEDGRAIDGKLENLKKYYDRGIRLISLTWNTENCFGFPNSRDPAVMEKGLKPFGKEAVEYMNELGVIVDVSHLSDGGFDDICAIAKKPFVASHSSCRELSPHPRNLTDDMLRHLAGKGGIAGVNFGPEFLNADIACKDSTVELICSHINRMVKVGGVECVALGSDFDGIQGNLEVNGPDKMYLIFEKLKKDGYSEDSLEKLAWKNAMRVIKDTL